MSQIGSLNSGQQLPILESGFKPLAEFIHEQDSQRQVVSIRSESQKIGSSEVETVRSHLKQYFGSAIADASMRSVDQRIRDGEKVLGEHVLRAQLSAFEQFSPAIRYYSDLIEAQYSIVDLEARIADQESIVKDCEAELETRKMDIERYSSGRSSLEPGLTEPRNRAARNLEDAREQLERLKSHLSSAQIKVEESNSNLEVFLKALDQPLSMKEDMVHLKQEIESLESLLVSQTRKLEEAEVRVEHCKKQLIEKRENLARYSDLPFRNVTAPGLVGELEEAEKNLKSAESAKSDLAKEKADTEEFIQSLRGKLEALTVGPSYRRAQAMLDNIGDDPRFMELLETLAPGKSTGGMLGWFESLFGMSNTDVVKGVVTTLLAPAGVASGFRDAIRAEDCERRLDVSKKFMDDHPFSRQLANSLARANEAEKWKLGVSATISYVSMALTYSVPGTTAPLAHLTNPLSQGLVDQVSQSTHRALGSVVGEGVFQIGKFVIQSGPTIAVFNALDSATQKLADTDGSRSGVELLKRALSEMAANEECVVPMVRVKPFGSQHQMVRDLPISEPKVAVALLAYLAPGASEEMLRGTSEQREMETRRLAMREELFGASRDEDMQIGKPRDKSFEDSLIEQLDSQNSRFPESDKIVRTSPLHLLCSSLGLLPT